MSEQRVVRKAGLKVIQIVEDVGLMLILVATLVAVAQEIGNMVTARRVAVSDLLLLFIFMEVVSMISIYWRLNKLPVRMPLYIAMVSLARYLILDSGELHEVDAGRDIFISLAILVLAISVFVVRYGHLKFGYPDAEDLPKT
ncbi:MAG TPA: phosphate-starvation-inducible PsiE family protein [Rhodanobacteraceae bacterium]|jgi:protein PsiE|nr:phosphate-starvation-inducible PsiE family protein [Rhodanobacteraceae bacterium]